MASKDHIQNDLEALSGGDFSEQAKQLLATLGYSSKRTIPYSGDPSEFFTDPSDTISRKNLLKQATSLKLVFQLTDEEISGIGSLFDNNEVDESRAESFYFVTAELQPGTYSRTKYAEMTREINKRYEQSPAVILFRVDKLLTIAFIGRRPHKHDQARDVLGKVTLIKDIRLNNPHRAHLDILSELSLEECAGWIENKNKQKNFDGLLSAWLAKLDTEELNKRFYMQLFKWFERAEQKCTFPGRKNKVFLSPQEHIIRLITRLMFIWFIKEKGLIAPALFNEEKIRTLLKDYDPDNGASYYRAVLQNLFFATLNTETGKRHFSKQTNTTHRDFSLYRYKAEMKDPGKLLELFAQTPFINGGLFDCLDSLEGQKKGYRIDCFSDHPKHFGKLSIPNHLFFGEGGLIPLFEHYKFTVEENTPIEQEVALDPELLGKVFENLLAAYNPETSKTARKQTGSYYTPRAVVDYMVDEALIACLAEKVQPNDGDREYLNARLRYLLDYADAFNDADELFVDAERGSIVRAIMEMKILDPAVGSGAFPMGTLHKLTLALRRLNPRKLWEELQKEKAKQRAGEAFETADQHRRDEKLKEISDIFQRYKDSDFGCKLYLIQNNLFGVDIQPVACQIAKLRFFISLAIEQDMQAKDHNYGIKPLPNLETRFVAANTLLGLGAGERTLTSDKARHLERELYANREQYFHATNRRSKQGCQDRDIELRDELAKELQLTGMPADDADKIAHWDPYDQNASSDWFDAEYMFGINDGFDVVIGNPPYINVENLSAEMRDYLFENYQSCKKRTDIYIAFLEKSLSILNRKGLMCFIIPASFAKQKYGTKMRQTLIDNHYLLKLVDASSYRIFENTVVYNVILAVTKDAREALTEICLHKSNADFENNTGKRFFVDQTFFSSLKESRFDTNPAIMNCIKIKEKIWQKSLSFDQICFIAYGARLNHRSAKIGKSNYVNDSPAANRKKFCEGHNIERYFFSLDGWLNYTPNEHYNPMFPELFENEKLMFINIVTDRLRFAYDNKGFYNSHTVINCVRLDLLSKVPHRSVARVRRSADITLAKKFDYKFLLAVLNSQLVNWYFLNFLSEGLHCYPNDAKELPIPKVSIAQQRPFIYLVDNILKAKESDSSTDTSNWETEIDHLVYKLYDLTTEEIATVEK